MFLFLLVNANEHQRNCDFIFRKLMNHLISQPMSGALALCQASGWTWGEMKVVLGGLRVHSPSSKGGSTLNHSVVQI